jgi:deazaflavin-dependent oxidoreductase (nitroreductase family)
VDDDLVAAGRVVRIETRGRVTGHTARATVGFVEQPDGSLLVAAGSPRADWALNLLADPHCRTTIGAVGRDAVARELEGPEHAAAVRELILRYGTPAEGLGAGPAFELRPEG